MIRKLFSSSVFVTAMSNYQWYRRWYGGRWERHWIDVCHAQLWLSMPADRCWPAYRQPCSVGTPTVEDYPIKS